MATHRSPGRTWSVAGALLLFPASLNATCHGVSTNTRCFALQARKHEAAVALANLEQLALKADVWYTRRNELYDRGEVTNHHDPMEPSSNFIGRLRE